LQRESDVQTAYRWYRIKLGGSSIEKKTFAKKVAALNGDAWFQIDDADGGEFRFFKRNEVWVEQYDRSGQSTRQRVEGDSSTSFCVLTGQDLTILRVQNPGRNMQFLMSALENALGFGFSAKPLAMGSWAASAVLRRADVSKLVSLKITNVAVRADCVGRMEFASKEGIATESIPFLRNLSFKQELVKYELIYKGSRGHFSATSGGLVRHRFQELWLTERTESEIVSKNTPPPFAA
jgi:hypothetical protein